MKTILITGGSHGLGKALAARYSKENNVIILSSNAEVLSAAAHELGCDSEVCDVSDWNSVATAIQNILSRHQSVDVLINNAGLYARGKVEDIDPAEAEHIYKVNVLGPLYVTKAVVPGMKARNSGVIININSQGGLYPKAERTLYQGSKWALTGVTKCLQLELAPFGIKVTGLYPGALELSMKSSGEVTKQPKSIPYDDVIDAVDYVLARKGAVYIPEIGTAHL